MMSSARISVVIPCHNAGAILGETIQSILGQVPPRDDVEVIIVDDRSTDDETLRVIRHWSADHRVRVVSSQRRPGPAGARNTGVAAARGEWIAFLDADDLWLPDALQQRWNVIEREPDASFVSADFGYLHPDGRRELEGFYRTRTIPSEVLRDAFETGQVLRLERPVPQFLRAVLVWTGVVLVRRSFLMEVGEFDESLGQVEDDHMWIRLARRADLFFVPRVIAIYRQRDGSLTSRKPSPAGWNLLAYRKLLADPDFREYRKLIRRRLSLFAIQNAYYHRSRSEWLPAARAAALAAAWDPGNPARWKALLGSLMRRG